MPDRFVNLQPKLRTLQNYVEGSFGTLRGRVQRHRLFPNAPRILDQPELVNQFVTFVLPLAAKGIRIRSLLNFAPRERIRDVSGAGRDFRLMNLRAFRGKEPL